MRDRIRNFIVEELLDGRSVDHSDDLLLSGILDSLGVMRLVAFLEEEFAKPVPPEDVTIENFSTIEAIAAYIGQNGNGDLGAGSVIAGLEA